MFHWTDILGLAYLGFELFILATRRGKVKAKLAKPADRGTIYAAWTLILGSCITGFFLARHIRLLNWPAHSPVIIGLAVLLELSGVALRIWAIRHLGRFFTVAVGIQHGHHVIQDGPYCFVRHPSYSGSLLALIGVGCLTFNWLGLILIATCTLWAYAIRIPVEEKALLAEFGDEYEKYAAGTKRMIPGIY
ncbi:MAG TPA: isoprenylcysteine carboxylmethyltransferase family protein [Chthoniobacterales bacterium]|nr:isoprenylcysteine carboxylmethyltransferase family protein [Chthoniobacterales bacterium]